MSMYGANPEELAALGSKLKAQQSSIDGVISTVTGALSGTTWVGPAREQFESDWNGTFRSGLAKLNDAFGAAGQDCLNRSQALRSAMGG